MLFDQLSCYSFRGTAEAFSYYPAAREVATPLARPQRMRRPLSRFREQHTLTPPPPLLHPDTLFSLLLLPDVQGAAHNEWQE